MKQPGWIAIAIVLVVFALAMQSSGGSVPNHASYHASASGDSLYHHGTFVWTVSGDLTSVTLATPVHVVDSAISYGRLECYITTAPTGSAVQVNVQEGGTDIFNDANRVEVAATGISDESGDPTDTTGADDDVLKLIIDAVDSGDTGADMTCTLHYTRVLSIS